jgi:hypothetical protein
MRPLRRTRTEPRLFPALSALAAAALGLAGCGGARFEGNVFHGEGFAFRVPPPPPAWERIDVSHGSLAFRDKANGATVAVNGRCGRDAGDVPLGALTQHLFLMFTDRTIVKEEVVPFDGREAMHTVLTAKLDGVPKQFEVWVMKKDGCVYDIYYIAPPERYPLGQAAFDRFARGFATVSSHAD